jgi:ATP-binding cassette subfamily B (MDR/TAP) protein 1
VSVAEIKKENQNIQEEEENIDFEKEEQELASKAFNKADAWKAAVPEVKFYIVGALGCAIAGGVFPAWGIVFAELIGLLFYPAFPCDESLSITYGYPTCDAYYDSVAETLKDLSYEIAVKWTAIIAACLVGNLLAFWGLGHATESINRRMRNLTFSSLMRQEVAFFDKRNVGSITSQLQDDVTMIQSFSSEPIRTMVINLASVATGLTISFICESGT